MSKASRRQFVKTTGWAGIGSVASVASYSRFAHKVLAALPGDEFLGILPFFGEHDRPMNVAYGEGLGGRLIFDHAGLSEDTLVTSNDLFYIRTRYPDQLREPERWSIRVHGLVEQPTDLYLDQLQPKIKSMGVHLLECSGNSAYGHFGLISAAQWTGIPVTDVLGKVPILPQATRVLISGFDKHSGNPRGSTPGASWVFTFDELEQAGAFLATHMNGKPLPRDHGAPVRLVMPGWYGCTCIKWVNEIKLVDDRAEATSQMREYAGRTHQNGIPPYARDFQPSVIDQTAMPVRVEKWRVDGEIVYRVIGIMWGGNRLTDKLTIRFQNGMSPVPVEAYVHETNQTWTLWAHTWRPKETGTYPIQLHIDDPTIRTRRLDVGYYTRRVEVDEI